MIALLSSSPSPISVARALSVGEFIAAAQLVVYAGAIMVLFIFVIMLLNADIARQFEFVQQQWVNY